MKVRSQFSIVFHLDKCIGCHTCSVACKNIWTDRKGAEYMWWNNVETRPGTGYPTRWEDQEKYKGGWEVGKGRARRLRLKLQDRLSALGNIFYNPALPSMDDYYEPWTYRYGDLFTAPQGDDQPTARPISLVDGRPMEIEAGPNWDDDLGGSPVYAAHDGGAVELVLAQRPVSPLNGVGRHRADKERRTGQDYKHNAHPRRAGPTRAGVPVDGRLAD